MFLVLYAEDDGKGRQGENGGPEPEVTIPDAGECLDLYASLEGQGKDQSTDESLT